MTPARPLQIGVHRVFLVKYYNNSQLGPAVVMNGSGRTDEFVELRRTSISLRRARPNRRPRPFVRLRTEAAAVRWDCEVIVTPAALGIISSRADVCVTAWLTCGSVLWLGRPPSALNGNIPERRYWGSTPTPIHPSAAGLKWCLSASLRGPGPKKDGGVQLKYCKQPGFYHRVYVCHPQFSFGSQTG